ncbi:MAG: hypothetical protein V2J02_14285 [Pseudomonadales bacterium]|jgi:hypothetical protein|nr:hypothetical protein [Pseudomonadales bacterium]
MERGRRKPLKLFIAALALGIAPPSMAKRRFRVGGGLRRGHRPIGHVLTRAQLRECVAMEERIETMQSTIDSQKTELDGAERDLETLGTRLDREAIALDRYSQESVDRYNALVERHRQQIDAFNARVNEYNRLVDDGAPLIDRYNSSCAERAYYEDDLAAVLAER